MSQIIIDIGDAPDDGLGTPLRQAFSDINTMFSEVYAAGPASSNIAIVNNSITTTVTNGNIILGPSGIGVVQANSSILPRVNNVYDLGSPTLRWNSMYLGASGFNTTGNISAKNLLITGNTTLGNIDVANLTVANNFVVSGNITGLLDLSISNTSSTGNLVVTNLANVVGNLTVGQDVLIAGNLTVQGNTVFINIENLNVEDPIIGIGRGPNNAPLANNDGKDRGEQLWYYTNQEKSAFIGYDNSAGNLIAATDVSITDEIVSVNNYGNITLGNVSASTITASGNIIANRFIGEVPASTNQLYVATNGSDSNNGKINTPFLTLDAALAAATAGTSIHIAPGTYTINNPVTIPANVSIIGDNLRSVVIQPQTPANDMFYVTNGCYVWGITIRNYLANGFSYNPATPSQNVFVSPYIQNLTSFTTTGTAVKIDGSLSSASSTKAMIVGFFTIINRGGLGIHIINSGYSQLVNIYTIACNIGIKVESGGFCTLNGSDCSIGNYGLWAEGLGPLQTAGDTVGYSTQGTFRITNQTNGRPHVNTIMKIPGDLENYTIDQVIPVNATTTDIVVQQPYIGNLAPNTNVEFYVRSSIIASAHTFEYVGAGTNPATALPQYGGIPIEENEVVQIDGGVVTYTSTDQKGNFKVGDGFTINQATGEITGDYFYKSLFAQMTPYILALQP